jgi:hypothetical protein
MARIARLFGVAEEAAAGTYLSIVPDHQTAALSAKAS